MTGTSITTREAEFNDRDRALILASYERDTAPRGSHGVLIAEATDPRNNPASAESTGRFVAKPFSDFAQDAVDKAKKARRDAVGDDDWPLLWVVHHEQLDEPDSTA